MVDFEAFFPFPDTVGRCAADEYAIACRLPPFFYMVPSLTEEIRPFAGRRGGGLRAVFLSPGSFRVPPPCLVKRRDLLGAVGATSFRVLFMVLLEVVFI